MEEREEQSTEQTDAPVEDESIVDVAELDAELRQPDDEAAVEAAPDQINRIWNALGDDSEDDGGYLAKLTDEELEKELRNAPGANVVLRALRKQYKAGESKKDTAIADREEAIQQRAAELAAAEKALIKSQSELGELFSNPEVRAILKARRTPEELQQLDLLTPAGQQAYLDAQIADRFGRFVEPITKVSEVAQKRAAVASLYEQYPKLHDKKFKSKVDARIVAAKEAGEDIHGKAANFIIAVEREELLREKDVRRKRERQARQKSAARVGKATTSADPDGGASLIPSHILNSRNGSDLAIWLQAQTPQKRARIMAARKSGTL